MECRVEFDYEAQESDELSLNKGDLITQVVTKMDGWWEGTLETSGQRGMFPDNFVKVITSHSSSSGDEVQSAGDAVKLRMKSGNNARRLKALFSYSPEQDDELPLEVGDVVDFIAEVEEGWWRGQLKGRTGIFPSNFVSEVETTTSTPAVAQQNGNKNGAQEPSKAEVVKQNDTKIRAHTNNAKVTPDVVPTEKPRAVSVEEEPAPRLPPKPVRETARCFYPYPAQNEDELHLEEGDIVIIISKDCEDEGWWRGELRGKTGVFPDNFVQIISPNDPTAPSGFPPTSTSNPSGQPQPTMTASERTSDEMLSANIAKKKEPSPSGGPNTTTVTVVDGGGNSKFSFDNDVTPSKGSAPVKKSSFLRNKNTPAPSPPITRPQTYAPVSSTIVFKAKPSEVLSREKSLEAPIDPLSDFNEIERGEKLVHLTANRAKLPRRRPPSTGTPKENESNTLNGSTNSFEETTVAVDNSPAPALHSPSIGFSAGYKSANAKSAITPSSGNESFSPKDVVLPNHSPTPVAASSAPKAPWLAELRKKQDKKQSSVGGTASSVSPIPSPVSASAPQKDKEKDTGSTPPPPNPTTREAPPLPIKPVLGQVSPAPTFDRTLSNSPTAPNPSSPSLANSVTTPHNSANPNITSTTIATNNNLSSVASKFGGQKRSVTTINHASIGNGNMAETPQSPTVGIGSATPEWVPYEEFAKLKDKVATMEVEAEILKKQVKLLLDRNFSNSKGHIV